MRVRNVWGSRKHSNCTSCQYNSPYTNTAGRREQTRGSLLLVSLLTFVDSDVRVIGGVSRALPARANQEARGQRVRRSKASCLGGYARASSNSGHECTPISISPRHLTNAARRYAHCCATSLRDFELPWRRARPGTSLWACRPTVSRHAAAITGIHSRAKRLKTNLQSGRLPKPNQARGTSPDCVLTVYPRPRAVLKS